MRISNRVKPTEGRHLSSADVLARYGISRRTLRRWIADEAVRFPNPRFINRRHYYRESDIVRWEMIRDGFDPDEISVVNGLKAASGVINDYGEFVDAMIKHRAKMKLTTIELDAVSGMQEGYTSKLENWERPQGRGMGPEVFPLWLGGLRLGIVLVELPRTPRNLKKLAAQLDATQST
ncbi:helix-turn-helix transcriptional regulator [Rhizobium sp. Z1P35]